MRQYEEYGVRSFGAFNAGYNPQVAIDDAKTYPIYVKCVELNVPIFSCAGVPGPRFPMWPQEVSSIDQVMYDFPELAFAPKHYPQEIIDFANTRGADKIIYAGYFPMGLTLDRIMHDMQDLGLHDSVWPKFLRDNAKKVLKI